MADGQIAGLSGQEIQAVMTEVVVELFNSPRFAEVPTAIPLEDRGIVIGSEETGWYLVKPRDVSIYFAVVISRLMERNNERIAEQLAKAGVKLD
jgi:hypothetical protein